MVDSWPLAGSRLLTSDPDLLTNSDLKEGADTCPCVWPIVWSIVRSVVRNPTVLKWVACFVAIQSLSDESLDLGRLIGQWFLVVYLCKSSCPLVPWTASGPRQNLSTNRLPTCIWSFIKIKLDYLAITRSSIFGKLPALQLVNLRPPLPRIAMVGWSWRWRAKSHIGCIQASFFFHRYDGSFGGFVERELQLLLHY